MNISASKENILKKIRKALSESTPLPFSQSEGNNSVFQPPAEELELQFAQEFTRLLGKFAYCVDLIDLKEQLTGLCKEQKWDKIYLPGTGESELSGMLKDTEVFAGLTTDLENCDASITFCDYLVARTGSIVLSSAGDSGRAASVYAPVHICIAYTDQLVYDVKEALQLSRDKYSDLPSVISFATGPSRTADIEKTLVVGVHGPREVYLFLTER